MLARLHFLIWLAVIVPLLAQPASASTEIISLGESKLKLSKGLLVRYFDQLVFPIDGGPSQNVLWKWSQPIRIKVLGEPNKLHMHWVRTLMTDMAKTTKLGMSLVKDYDTPNFLIALSNNIPRDLDGPLRDAVLSVIGAHRVDLNDVIGKVRDGGWQCYFHSSRGSRGDLQGALIILRRDMSELDLMACLSSQFMRTLGLRGASHSVPSVLQRNNVQFYLNDYERMLIRLLYMPVFKPGMPKDDARVLLKRFLKLDK